MYLNKNASHKFNVESFLRKIQFLFFWVKLFYPKSKGMKLHHIFATCFITQKIFRINGRVPWPVHYTSRVLYPKKIKVGNRCAPGWSHGCYIQGRNGINIGDNVRMGPNVGVISANHNVNDYDQWDIARPIEIGNNVWIGMNSVVLPGVSIGDNVIIAANSVVNRDIPSNVIAAGNPCKVIKEKPPYQGFDYGKL